ncbi:hypothetical protein P4H46_20920 [Paenibacillus glucanolyticus]
MDQPASCMNVKRVCGILWYYEAVSIEASYGFQRFLEAAKLN